MKMDARKQKVLLAIVTDYIATAEPVGSRTIARKYKLGVSPATIRNEMADLEEMGYIEQPHTSAGRVPSELGYRYYVDYLMQKYELKPEEELLIRRSYESKARDIGEVIQRTGQLLSQLTNYAAVVMSPELRAGSFKHIQLVPMAPGQAMCIVVMNTGTVYHRMLSVPESVTPGDLETISKVLNAKLEGHTIETIRLTLLKEVFLELTRHKQVLNLALEILEESLNIEGQDRIYLGGLFNILNQPEFNNVERVKTLLSILEQEDLLRNLLMTISRDEGVTVRIGAEISCQEIKNCSMVTARYSIAGQPVGTIGVLGPTRMDYAKVVSVVECMSRHLTRALEALFNKGCRF